MAIVLPPMAGRGGYAKVGGIWTKASGVSDSGVPVVVAAAGGGGGGNVTIDTSGSAQNTGDSTCVVTLALTVGILTNGFMTIGVTVGCADIVSVVGTWNTTETLVAVNSLATSASGKVYAFKVLAPSSGTHNLVVTVTSTTLIACGVHAATWSNVNQSGPVTGTGTTAGPTNDTLNTVTISSAVGNVVWAIHGAGDAYSVTNETQLSIQNINGSTSCGNGASNYAAGAASKTLTATHTSDTWVSIALDIIKA